MKTVAYAVLFSFRFSLDEMSKCSYLHAIGAFVMFSMKDCKREYVLDSIVYDISDKMQKK